jgi:membrane protease YdiL (CAAX protease family)
MVSGLLNTSFQVGGAIFLAIVTAVVTANAGHGTGAGSPQAVLDSYRPGLVVVSAVALGGLLITLTGLRRRSESYGILVASSTESAPSAADATADTTVDVDAVVVAD